MVTVILAACSGPAPRGLDGPITGDRMDATISGRIVGTSGAPVVAASGSYGAGGDGEGFVASSAGLEEQGIRRFALLAAALLGGIVVGIACLCRCRSSSSILALAGVGRRSGGDRGGDDGAPRRGYVVTACGFALGLLAGPFLVAVIGYAVVSLIAATSPEEADGSLLVLLLYAVGVGGPIVGGPLGCGLMLSRTGLARPATTALWALLLGALSTGALAMLGMPYVSAAALDEFLLVSIPSVALMVPLAARWLTLNLRDP